MSIPLMPPPVADVSFHEQEQATALPVTHPRAVPEGRNHVSCDPIPRLPPLSRVPRVREAPCDSGSQHPAFPASHPIPRATSPTGSSGKPASLDSVVIRIRARRLQFLFDLSDLVLDSSQGVQGLLFLSGGNLDGSTRLGTPIAAHSRSPWFFAHGTPPLYLPAYDGLNETLQDQRPVSPHYTRSHGFNQAAPVNSDGFIRH